MYSIAYQYIARVYIRIYYIRIYIYSIYIYSIYILITCRYILYIGEPKKQARGGERGGRERGERERETEREREGACRVKATNSPVLSFFPVSRTSLKRAMAEIKLLPHYIYTLGSRKSTLNTSLKALVGVQ